MDIKKGIKMNTRTILHGSEYMLLHENGYISRPAIKMETSDNWKVIGCVRYNNFGNIVERRNLNDIVAGKIKDWFYGNGKQKWHIVDSDHGTIRIWMCKHKIF